MCLYLLWTDHDRREVFWRGVMFVCVVSSPEATRIRLLVDIVGVKSFCVLATRLIEVPGRMIILFSLWWGLAVRGLSLGDVSVVFLLSWFSLPFLNGAGRSI